MSIRPEVLAKHHQRAITETTPKHFAVRPISGSRGANAQFQVTVFDPAAPEGEALPFMRWLATREELRAFAERVIDAIDRGFTNFDTNGRRR